MSWARIGTEPLDVDSQVCAQRARAIGAALERVAVPILWLRAARPRVLVDPGADLAAVRIGCRRSAGLLRRHWRVAPFDSLGSEARAHTYVLAGFPYAQMRRVGPTLHARPLVLFARGEMDDGQLKLSYRRIARRADGLEIH